MCTIFLYSAVITELFEPRCYQIWYDLGQVTNNCLPHSVLTTLVLVAIMREVEVIGWRTMSQVDLFPTATTNDSCKEKYRTYETVSEQNLNVG